MKYSHTSILSSVASFNSFRGYSGEYRLLMKGKTLDGTCSQNFEGEHLAMNEKKRKIFFNETFPGVLPYQTYNVCKDKIV